MSVVRVAVQEKGALIVELVEKGDADVERPDGRGLTPLMALFAARPSPFAATAAVAAGAAGPQLDGGSAAQAALLRAVQVLASRTTDPGRCGGGRTVMEWVHSCTGSHPQAEAGREAMLQLPQWMPTPAPAAEGRTLWRV